MLKILRSLGKSRESQKSSLISKEKVNKVWRAQAELSTGRGSRIADRSDRAVQIRGGLALTEFLEEEHHWRKSKVHSFWGS